MKNSCIKRILVIIVFLLLLSVFLIGAYRVLNWKDTTGDYFSSTKQMYELDDNTVDVAFFGPSVFYNGINPAILWEEEGIASFNASVAGQDRNASYYFVKEFIKNQSPKVVVLSATYFFNDHYDLEGNLYRNTISLNQSKNYVDLVNDIVPPNEKSANNKISDYYLRWPIIHGRYKELKKYDFYDTNEYKDTLGFSYAPDCWSDGVFTDESLNRDYVLEISEQNREWVDKMKALGDENGFEILVVATPKTYDITSRGKLNGCFEYLDTVGIKHVDINNVLDEIEFVETKDMCDASHPNAYGAEKISKYLSSYLKANYSLEDHRGNAGYEIYDRCVTKYNHNVLMYKNVESMNADELLSLGDRYTGLVYTVTYHKDDERDEKAVRDYLLKCNVSEEALNAGGTWIIQNNTVLKSPQEKTYGVKVSNADYLYVLPTANNESYFDTVYVGDTQYVDFKNNVCCILIYDTLLERVIIVKDVNE